MTQGEVTGRSSRAKARHHGAHQLFADALLQGQPPSERVERLGERAEPREPLARHVGELGDAGGGQEVVRTHRPDLDLAEHDDRAWVGVVTGKRLRLEQRDGIEPLAFEQLIDPRVSDAATCADEILFGLWIMAKGAEEIFDGSGGCLTVHERFFRLRVGAFS